MLNALLCILFDFICTHIFRLIFSWLLNNVDDHVICLGVYKSYQCEKKMYFFLTIEVSFVIKKIIFAPLQAIKILVGLFILHFTCIYLQQFFMALCALLYDAKKKDVESEDEKKLHNWKM